MKKGFNIFLFWIHALILPQITLHLWNRTFVRLLWKPETTTNKINKE